MKSDKIKKIPISIWGKDYCKICLFIRILSVRVNLPKLKRGKYYFQQQK